MSRLKLYILLPLILFCLLFTFTACESTSKVVGNNLGKQKKPTNIKKKIPKNEQFMAIKLVDAKTNYLNTVKIMGDTSKFIDLCETKKAFKGLCQKEKEIKTYSQQRHFCHNIFNDFINNKNIKIINPVVHTNDFNDKKLQSYWKKCPYFQQRLNIISSEALPMPNGIYDSCISSSEDWVKCTEGSYLPKSGAYGHFNYQLYNIDFDNNSKNGVQTLFYTGGLYNPEDSVSFDAYSLIDFKKCKIINKFKVEESIYFLTLKKTRYFYGLFKYMIDGKYYIYEFEAPNSENNYSRLYFNYLKSFTKDGIVHFDKSHLNSDCGYENIQ